MIPKSRHEQRWKREDELAAQGVDYILESRKGPIGRLVKRLPKDFPLRDKIIAESERQQKLIHGSKADDLSL